MLSNTSNVAANSAALASGAAPKASQTDAAASQDRFLKLLVAQLNNQDPMNPLDNAQMTSQMAQINTVSGIQQLNDTMKSMASQFTANQLLQGASMIGREVLTQGNALSVQNGIGRGAMDLAGDADKVTVQVLTAGGQSLGTLQLGPRTAGRQSFELDASSFSNVANPIFKVIATQGTKEVLATPLNRNTVESVSAGAEGMRLGLQGSTTVGYEAIKAIL